VLQPPDWNLIPVASITQKSISDAQLISYLLYRSLGMGKRYGYLSKGFIKYSSAQIIKI
jgi:hypothetical protein